MDNQEKKKLSTVEEIKIFSAPYRLRIMKTFLDFGRPATVKEVADRMGEVPAKVYYHVKKLESIGLAYIDHTEVINGIVAKYYQFHSGEIEIKSADIEPEMQDVYWSNVRRLLAEQFDLMKEKFLSRAIDGKTDTGRFTQNVMYMTPEESDEVFRQMNALLAPYEHRRAGDGRLAYDLFIAMGADKAGAGDAGPEASSEAGPPKPKSKSKPGKRK